MSALLAPLGPGTASADQPRPDWESLRYSQHGTLDLARNEGRPLVVFVHGGGWAAGDKSAARVFAGSLLEAGYAVASVDYRLAPMVTLDVAAGDIADAINYLAKNEDPRRFDSRRIAAMGHSAGAHLLALAATRAKLSPSVRAIILFDGIGYDLRKQVALQPGLLKRMGVGAGALDDLSPLAHMNTVPKGLNFWIAAGEDRRQTREQGQEFAQQLAAHGVAAEFTFYPGAEHSAFLRDLQYPGKPITRDLLSFLAKNLASR